MVTKVKCPTCQSEIEWGPQSPFRPFCSKRCQLIDLGEWADEQKRIPGEMIGAVASAGHATARARADELLGQ